MASRAEAWLYARLLASGPVRALVAERVYPAFLPQGDERPAIVYRRAATERSQHAAGGDGRVTATIELHCLATAYGDSKRLADAVREALDGARDTDADPPIQRCYLRDESDIAEPPVFGGEQFFFDSVLAFELVHDESRHAL